MLLTLEFIPVTSLRPTEAFSEDIICDLLKSITCSSFNKPLFIDRENRFILDGHHRYEAAQRMGVQYLPAFLLDHRDKAVQAYSRDTGEILNKKELYELYKLGKLLRVKSTKYVVESCPDIDLKIPLSMLMETEIKKGQVFPSPSAVSMSNGYTELKSVVSCPVFVKNEGFNLAGSIKLKPARRMIKELEKKYPGKSLQVIESTSGNMGVALSMVCAERGHKFTAVVDPNITEQNLHSMLAMGSNIITVNEKDSNGGYLQTRINRVRSEIQNNRELFWSNQYTSDCNWLSHFESTAPEIFNSFPKVDFLFVGAGTLGTLIGCEKYFRQYSKNTKVIAIDILGSVTFGSVEKSRHIPGLGASKKPPLLQHFTGAHVHVSEEETLLMAQELSSQGCLYGGSTCSVLAGIRNYFKEREIFEGATIVAISPDFGAKYLETMYSKKWCEEKIGFFKKCEEKAA
ncbi:MAG: pyridoxal-phosphate dependent enzyme [Alphaproteobacteria bacterium]|jgi:N-(2-amino-2-carboxyethyl)-L-glutamate synthase|nr:pyridoxal-phosphate dependent enzyme [Alphaproteobacteria bacterium]MBT5389559.1 pyridoxal-phosphate dependent enzyme [Alphaproteobacteria bacterium]